MLLKLVGSKNKHSLSFQIPVYLTEETEQTGELLETLASSNQGTDDKKVSGAQALLDGIISNGFQLVSSASNPKLASDQSILTIEAAFNGVSESGLGEEDTLPTVVVAAHYDASGGSPALSFGADSNGSGVTILMELARLWSHLYRTSSRSRPGFNLIFLLTGGGKINFLGTKKWLDEQKDNANSELFNNIK